HKFRGHAEAWGFTSDLSHLCQFKIIHSVREEYSNDTGTYYINVNKGTARHNPDLKFTPRAVLPANLKTSISKENLETLKKLGYDKVADNLQEMSASKKTKHVAGQPCISITGPNALYGENCTWTGGEKWGFGIGKD